MAPDDEFTHADRVMMIGVLANVAAYFMEPELDGNRHLMDRYRRDLGAELGHIPSDEECRRHLEGQIVRLRHSIGERW